MKNYIDLDRRHIWHPFTQAEGSIDPICIVRAAGNKLFDAEGREYLDMISSWWVNIHGHAHPKIASAIAAQAMELEQVIFADFTHPPAIELAQNLIKHLKRNNPSELNRVFFSDNGSTAVEVALKQSMHYWKNMGRADKTGFIAFDGAYHGDTVGAMAVGRKSGFFESYKELLFNVTTIPFPETWIGDTTVEEREQASLNRFKSILDQNAEKLAAVIIEPLVQGAAGMRICRPEFIRSVIAMAREHELLAIFDEVMTGFGRTGTFCAYEQCGAIPDILCLSKGLTGGFIPLSLTISSEKIYDAFRGANFDRALAHGHSFTANPIACAAANASLSLFKSENTMAKIALIAGYHKSHFTALAQFPNVKNIRCMGVIAALDLDVDATYGGKLSQDMKLFFLNRGLLIRPIGNSIYILPPYCTTEPELQKAYNGIGEVAMAFGKSAIPLVA